MFSKIKSFKLIWDEEEHRDEEVHFCLWKLWLYLKDPYVLSKSMELHSWNFIPVKVEWKASIISGVVWQTFPSEQTDSDAVNNCKMCLELNLDCLILELIPKRHLNFPGKKLWQKNWVGIEEEKEVWWGVEWRCNRTPRHKSTLPGNSQICCSWWNCCFSFWAGNIISFGQAAQEIVPHTRLDSL